MQRLCVRGAILSLRRNYHFLFGTRCRRKLFMSTNLCRRRVVPALMQTDIYLQNKIRLKPQVKFQKKCTKKLNQEKTKRDNKSLIKQFKALSAGGRRQHTYNRQWGWLCHRERGTNTSSVRSVFSWPAPTVPGAQRPGALGVTVLTVPGAHLVHPGACRPGVLPPPSRPCYLATSVSVSSLFASFLKSRQSHFLRCADCAAGCHGRDKAFQNKAQKTPSVQFT